MRSCNAPHPANTRAAAAGVCMIGKLDDDRIAVPFVCGAYDGRSSEYLLGQYRRRKLIFPIVGSR